MRRGYAGREGCRRPVLLDRLAVCGPAAALWRGARRGQGAGGSRILRAPRRREEKHGVVRGPGDGGGSQCAPLSEWWTPEAVRAGERGAAAKSASPTSGSWDAASAGGLGGSGWRGTWGRRGGPSVTTHAGLLPVAARLDSGMPLAYLSSTEAAPALREYPPPGLLSSFPWASGSFPALDPGIIDFRTLAHRGPGSRVPGPGIPTAGACINC